MTTSYATVEELKDYLNEPSTATRYEDLFAVHLDTASRIVDDYCDRIFYKEDQAASPNATAKTFHPDTATRLVARDFYSTTGLVVKVDDNLDGTYETTLTETTDYVAGPADLRAGEPYYRIDMYSRTFPRHPARPTIEVTALWGWNDIPAIIHTVCLELAAEKFKRKDAPFGVIGVDDFGPVRISKSDMRTLANIPDRLRRHPVLVA